MDNLAFHTGGRRARGAAGKRCYVIGDVHGRFDLLEAMVDRIRADNAARSRRETFLVLLGDMIDRGPSSRSVLDWLSDPPPEFSRTVCLKGNHEEALAEGLGGQPERLSAWLSHGGFECAQSYGVPIGGLFGAAPDVIERALAERIPAAHLKLIAALPDTVRFGDFLLVHAGIRPDLPLERQGRHVRWVRDEFLTSEADHGSIVIHGHTVSAAADIRPNRIGLDTGAWLSGRLTAARIEDEGVEIVTVQGTEGVAYRRGA